MTCPSCGTIAAMGAERCARCGSSLQLPANRPDLPIPVVRAPTARGEIAQRVAGIVTVSLVPHPPAVPSAPAPPSAPPALGGPVGHPGPYGAAPAVAPYGAPAHQPEWAPPDATPVNPAPATGWATQPPPPPSFTSSVTVAPPVVSKPPVDQTASYPTAVTPAVAHPSPPETPRNDDGDEVRPRAVRPGVDASWPPPPGPWSGRRTTES